MRGLSEGLQPEQALTLPRANLVQILTLACQPYLVPGPRTPGSDGSRGNPDLLPEMKAYWPDVIHSFPNRSRFWKHEWEKHGTCAAQVDALNSQKKYFGRSLELYRELDLNSVLLKLGIKPSINYYQDEEVQTVGQIELCLTKQDQQLQNCTEPGEQLSPKQKAWLADGDTESRGLRVCEDGPVFYPPPKKIKH
ncbi:ribonuclease T2 isoform X4 [Macaca fascicularis]|uniref:ribonuclease T2 isoform X4 n=1 Tax=Macaca fascicularis TaxID=9541 RepID=UPI003D15F218